MKILWVKSGKLLPLDTGGKLRTYNILRHLARAQEITFLSYYGGHRDERYELEISQHLAGTIAVHTGVPDAVGINRYLDYARRLPFSVPHSVSRFTSRRVRRILAQLMTGRRFDVAVCDFLVSAPNFPRSLVTPTVLFQHNVETVLWKRRAEFASTPVDRLVSKIEYRKMARFEPAQVRRFHHVLAVSREDREAMCQMVDPSRISVIPTGVDLAAYSSDSEWRPTQPLVVFTGSMDWEPNIDGVEYFCNDIWPIVLAQVPHARFRIVGRNPHPRVKKLASASIEITGTVPSIIDHLREAAVLVVPLRIGGGTRIKIYEGMAAGKATVSSFIGAEGLDVHHEHDILLADDPRQFARYVIRLLQDEAFRRPFEIAAAETVRQYDWSEIAQRFLDEIQKAVTVASRTQPISRSSWPDFLITRKRA